MRARRTVISEALESRRLLATHALVRLDGQTGPIDPTRDTWVIAHGWRSSPAAFAGLAAAIRQSATVGGHQIVAIDWSAAANTSILDPFSAEARIGEVAQSAASQLTSLGVAGGKLRFIGHSFGAYVAADTVRRLGVTRVDAMIALDPGIDLPGGFDARAVDFSAKARTSVAFHASSTYSDPDISTTAARAYVVDFQDTSSQEVKHSAVVSMLAGMFLQETTLPVVLKPSFYGGVPGEPLTQLPNGLYDADGNVGGDYQGVIHTRTDQTVPLAILEAEFAGNGAAGLWIPGTSAGDTIHFTPSGPGVASSAVQRNGVSVAVRNPVAGVVLTGGAGDDRIFGSDRNEAIFGGEGRDALRGGPGSDTIYGESGADSVWGGDAADTVYGGSGNDLLRGEAGDDAVDGGSGQNRLRGGDGADTLVGGNSNDKLYGNAGNDTLIGRGGTDRLFGYEGVDTAIDAASDILDSVENV